MTTFLISDYLKRLEKVYRFLSRYHYYPITLALIALSILLTGLDVIPREPYLLTAQDPFNHVEIYPENYFQSNPLLPLISYFTGLNSELGFRTLSFVLVCLAVIGAIVSAKIFYGSRKGLLFSGLLLSHPVLTVMLSWLGTPDPITFIVALVSLFSKSYTLLFAIGVLGSFNHPISLFSLPAILILRLSANENLRLWHLASLAAGLGVGISLVQVFLALNQIEVFSRVEFITDRNFTTWVRMNATHWRLALASLNGVVWLPIAASLLLCWRLDRSYYLRFTLFILTFYGITFFTADTTRVFSLLAWAPVLHCVMYSLDLISDGIARHQLERTAWLIITLGIVAPRYYAWTGEIHSAPFATGYIKLASQLRGLLR